MSTFLFTLAVFVVAFAAMAVGAILSGRCIRGSCGGIAVKTDDEGHRRCGLCGTPATDCERGASAPEED